MEPTKQAGALDLKDHSFGIFGLANKECGNTALMLASKGGMTGMVEKLLAARADPALTDAKGNTSLMLALKKTPNDTASSDTASGMLLIAPTAKAGAIDAMARDGMTALLWARKREMPQVEDEIRKAGAQIMVRGHDHEEEERRAEEERRVLPSPLDGVGGIGIGDSLGNLQRHVGGVGSDMHSGLGHLGSNLDSAFAFGRSLPVDVTSSVNQECLQVCMRACLCHAFVRICTHAHSHVQIHHTTHHYYCQGNRVAAEEVMREKADEVEAARKRAEKDMEFVRKEAEETAQRVYTCKCTHTYMMT